MHLASFERPDITTVVRLSGWAGPCSREVPPIQEFHADPLGTAVAREDGDEIC